MRFLIFLILGTILFGAAFPAFILISVLVLLILAIIMIFGIFTGLFGGKQVIIYKNGRRVDNVSKKNAKHSTADNPDVITSDDYNANRDIYDFGEQAEPEVVELPPSALSKDKGEERDG